MAAIWVTRDRLGREVTLTETRQAHILLKHPQVAGRLDDIRAVVETPDAVHADARYDRRENHYRWIAAGGRIKVVVIYRPVPPQGTWAGEVVTAYPVKQVDPAEVRLWP